MSSFRTIAWSSVGKKFITGITGLALFGFVIVHLLGNLTLFIGPAAFNGYAHFLEHLLHGWLIYAFEIGLLAVLVFHILAAVYVALFDKQQARPVKYALQRNAGGASRKTLSSRSMIITGLVLGAFIVIHVKMFKFGTTSSFTAPNGNELKDLYTLVATSFKNLLITLPYVAVMILLGFHLRHGVWSAFQSLGWNSTRYIGLLNGLALVFAFLLAIGFLILPLYLYFFVDPSAAQAALPGGH
jgi:succinate dehydrogenase / fumarate reductase cytochrome b subunit